MGVEKAPNHTLRYFYDTEFIEDGKTIDLVSIGIVCEDGREFYAQNSYCAFSRASDWVKENVYPHLTSFRRTPQGWRPSPLTDSIWLPPGQLRNRVIAFVGDTTPQWWASHGAYDHVALCQLFGKMIDLPKGWPFFTNDIQQLAALLGAPELPQQVGTAHNALDDARWTREAYDYLVKLAV